MSPYTFYGREKEIDNRPLSEVMLSSIAKYVKKPSLYGRYGEVAKKVLQLKAKPTDFIWGLESLDYTDIKLVTTDFSENASAGYLYIGIRGSGKSVLVRNHALGQLNRRFNNYICAIDPKQVDFSLIHKRQTNKKFLDVLNAVGLSTDPYNVKRIISKCLLNRGELPPSGAQQFMISVRDVRQLGSPQIQLNTLLYLMSLKQATASGEALQRVMDLMNNPSKRPEELIKVKYSTDLFYKLIINDVKSQQTQRVVSQEIGLDLRKRGMSSTQLYFKFKALIEQFVIGDPDERKKLKVDFVKELVDNGILVLLTNLDIENEKNTNAIIKILIHTLINDRVKFKDGNRSNIKYVKGLIDKQLTFVIDESDILIPADLKTPSPARNSILQLLTKYRQYGISLMLVTQDPLLIYPRFISQCRFILTPKVIYDSQAQILRERGVPDYIIEELRKMDANSTPKEWAVVDINKNMEKDGVQRFFPLPPDSDIPKENSTLQNPEEESEVIENMIKAGQL